MSRSADAELEWGGFRESDAGDLTRGGSNHEKGVWGALGLMQCSVESASVAATMMGGDEVSRS